MSIPRYPISDKDMLALLHKYPFLYYQNPWSRKREQTYHGKSQNIEHNYYKIWDGTGWEYLWKYKYLPRLFETINRLPKDQQRAFKFEEVKSKYGTMRIYCMGFFNQRLEDIAEALSGYTCEYCGAEPRDEHGTRVIWTTDGWITNLCKNCATAYLRENKVPEDKIEEELEEMKHVCQGFGYKQYSKHKCIEVNYKETPDGWLEKESEKEFTPSVE